MSLARLFKAIESYWHYHYYQRECLQSNSVVVVHSLNVYKYRVLSCFVFLPSIIPLLVFLPLFAPPSQSRLPKSICSYWLLQMKGCTFGLLFLSLVISLGEQIAEQGHVLNAVPGQWLVATSQFGIRAFFEKSQGQYQSPHRTVPNGLQGSCEIRFSGKGQDVVLNTNVIG
jgi:hypothetical protein